MKVKKYSIKGAVVGEVELSDVVFGGDVNDTLIYELIKAANSNLRQGTRKTKQRAEVSGGGIKPWRQKGTGRARQGSIRAPQWKGGGTIFGPLPQDYSRSLPKKMKAAAYRSLFSLKAKGGFVTIIEDFTVSGKTKDIAQIGKALSVVKGVLLTGSDDILVKRSIRNIPWFLYNSAKRISSRDIFYSKQLIITESALNYIHEIFGKGDQ